MSQVVLYVGADPDAQHHAFTRLREDGFDARAVDHALEATHAVDRLRPAAVILDGRQEDARGTEVLRRLRRHGNARKLPVLFLGDSDAEIDRVIAFELGADDYVTKPFSARELSLRVRAILRRAVPTRRAMPQRLDAGPLEIDIARHEVFVEGAPILLTALEFRLLVDLAQRAGHVQERRLLLKRVWDREASASKRTVDTHIKRLREKLGVAASLIETVRGVGYRFQASKTGELSPIRIA